MTTTPAEIVREFFDALDNPGGAAFLAALPDDATIDDWRSIYSGPAALTAGSDREFIGARGTLQRNEYDRAQLAAHHRPWRSSFAKGLSRFVSDVEDGILVRTTIREAEPSTRLPRVLRPAPGSRRRLHISSRG